MTKVMYKPLAIALGLLGGVLAKTAFTQVWKRIDDEPVAPKPTQEGYSWKKILLASALQGAILSVVKAAVVRGGAEGVYKATGTWPGETLGEGLEKNPAKKPEKKKAGAAA